MKYFTSIIIIFLSINLLAQENEHHQIPNDPEVRKIFIQAVHLMKNESIENNRIKALKKFKEAAKLNDPTAQFIVAEMYEKGLGTAKNEQKALYWYKESAKYGDTYAMQRVGLIYKNGKTVPQDFRKAAKWFKKSADSGNPVGKYFLAYMYYKGFGVEQNYKKAFNLAQQSANEDITGGKQLLAYCYEHGNGVKKDTEKAKQLYIECKKRGNKQAAVRLKKIKEKKKKQNKKNNKSAIIQDKDNNTETETELIKKTEYKPVKRDLNAYNTSFDGKWEGTLLLYDWSKKYVEEKSKLSIEIKQKEFNITGSWDNGQNHKMPFTAVKVGNVLYCKNALIKREGAFGETITWKVREGQLELLHKNGKTYLVGNLQMFNPAVNEPAQPSYFILSSVSRIKTVDTTNVNQINATKTDVAINNYVATRNVDLLCYPNPTNNTITIDYSLSEDGNTQISLINSAGQQIAVIKEKTRQLKGSYSVTANIKGNPGNYIIKLVHNNKIYTRSIIKN